jgi:hypothetical protein
VKLYAVAIGITSVSTVEITRTAWPTLHRRLKRAGAEFIRVPTREGNLVLTSATIGTPVENPVWWLEDALDQLVKGPRISTSRAWALVRQQQARGWTLVGVSREGPQVMARAAEITVGLDDNDQLINGDDPKLWNAFRRLVGLHLPARRRSETELE